MPVYNQEKYIEDSLTDVVLQSYKNLEIIVVNDGSTEKSASIIEAFSCNERVKIITKDNGGLVDAVIAGVNCASGEYIRFFDPDDRIGEKYISNYLANIGDADFVAMGLWIVNAERQREFLLLENRYYREKELRYYGNHFLLEKGRAGRSNRFSVSRSNKLYKTSVVKQLMPEYGKCRDVSLGEDTVFTYLLLKTANSGFVFVAPNEYYYHLDSETSMCRTRSPESHMQSAKTAFRVFSDMLRTDESDVD